MSEQEHRRVCPSALIVSLANALRRVDKLGDLFLGVWNHLGRLRVLWWPDLLRRALRDPLPVNAEREEMTQGFKLASRGRDSELPVGAETIEDFDRHILHCIDARPLTEGKQLLLEPVAVFALRGLAQVLAVGRGHGE